MTTRAEVLELASEAEAILPSVAVVLREYAYLLNGGNIVDRPKEAIERMRQYANDGFCVGDIQASLKAVLDWLEGKHVVDWPKELTRERLEGVSDSCDSSGLHNSAADIRALAAIAPERKKRVVNLWKHPNPAYEILAKSAEWTPFPDEQWRKVAGPIELEE